MAIVTADNKVTKAAQGLFVRGFKAWSENTSANIRTKLGLNHYDPLDPYSLAEQLRIGIWDIGSVQDLPADTLQHLSHPDSEWSAVTVSFKDVRVIVTNPSHNRGRTSSNIMHELAHIILEHQYSESFFVDELMLREYNEKDEAEADWLAGTLLLPRKALEYIKLNGIEKAGALERYSVSPQLYKYRCRMTAIDRQFKVRS